MLFIKKRFANTQGAFFIGDNMIVIKREDNAITVTGHANYAPAGYDIICASVTILAYNLIDSIVNLTTEKIKYDMQPGMVHIYFENESLSKDAQLLVDSFFISANGMAASYPKHVKTEQAWNS